MKKFLYKFTFSSFCVIFLISCLLTKLPLGYFGLILSVIYFLIILPIYFIASPLAYKDKSKILWVLPIINVLLFLISSTSFFNSGIVPYLLAYAPLSYIAIAIKYFLQSKG